MKKTILLGFLIIMSLFVVSCEWRGKEDSTFYKDIDSAIISTECSEYKDDVCGLFDCMVDMCWCDDSSPELPILLETHITFDDEQGAIDAVNAYLAELMFEGDEEEKEVAKTMKVTRAVELNNIFYNVFVEDANGNEETYTVAVDGTIIKTICGV